MKKTLILCLLTMLSANAAMAKHRIRRSHRIKPYTSSTILGIPLTTSPYLGRRTHFEGSEMIVNISTIHHDLRVLQFRQDSDHYLQQHNYQSANSPVVKLSGKMEGLYSNSSNFTTRSSDINLDSAELDFLVALNPHISGYFSLKYDNSPFPGVIRTARTGHARVFLDKGYITYGNLNESPMYATLGQFYLPYGRYSSVMISAPLPMLIGRIKGRALQVGYAQQDGKGVQGSVYVYRGDTLLGGTTKVNEGGINLDYVYASNIAHAKAGVSLTSNIAEAQNFQASGGTFPGFSNSIAFQSIMHRVPGIDIHALGGYKQWNFIAEYARASRAFNVLDLSYLGAGAKPSAFNLEAGYSFKMANKPSHVGVSLGHSAQASALGVPKNRVGVVFNTSPYRDTVATIELNHAVNYPTTVSMTSNGTTFNVVGGRTANTLIAKFGMYF